MRQQDRSEETRQHLLKAARVCFARFGYDASSVDDICKEAGITKGAFYYHFVSKQALFLELQKLWFSQFEDYLKKAHIDKLSVTDSLVEMQKLARNAFDEPNNYLPMTLEFWMYAIRNPLIQQGVNDHYQKYIQLLSQQLVEARVVGSINFEDPALVARAIIGLGMGLVLLGALDPQGTDWGNQLQESLRLLVNGLRPT